MQVNVPSIGLVNFPDSMSTNDVEDAIKTHILPASQQQARLTLDRAQPQLPVQGLLGQINSSFTTDDLKQGLDTLQGLNPTRFLPKPQGYVQGLAYNLDKMINPVTAIQAVAAPEALAARGLIGALARTGLMTQGAQSVGQGLGQRTAGVPLTSEQKSGADINTVLGALMSGAGYVPKPVTPNIKLSPTAFNDTLGSMQWEKANSSSRSPASTPTPVSKTTVPTPPVATTASPIKSVDYSPEDLVKYQQLNAKMKPTSPEQFASPEYQQTWKDFEALRNKYNGMPPANQPVTWKPAMQAGQEIIPVDNHGAGWSALQTTYIKEAKTAGLSHEDALKRADTQMSKVQRGFLGSDGKFYTLGEVARKQIEQNKGVQNDSVKNGQTGQTTGQPMRPVQAGSAVQDALKNGQEQQGQQKQVAQEGQVQAASKGEVPTGEGRVSGQTSGSNGVSNGGKGIGSVDKVDKTGEGGFVIAPKEIWSQLFSGNKATRVDPSQMYNRIKNVLGEGSSVFKALQNMGLQGFLSGPKNVQEVEDWAEKNSPKVEVRNFGADKISPELTRYNELSHTWLDSLTPANRGKVESAILDQTGYPVLDSIQHTAKAREYLDLRKQLSERGELDRQWSSGSHWQSIAPKSEKDMPGYVEIAVVKPPETYEQQYKKTGQFPQYNATSATHVAPQFPSSHNFPPNTLGFVRGYMENVGGKKVFHVIEVQSDWAQQERDAREQINNTGNPNTRDTRAVTKATQLADPLLPHYERLALKAAIDHARSEGADAIAISDAETAMMTEGHDRHSGQNYRSFDSKEAALDVQKNLEKDPEIRGTFDLVHENNKWILREMPMQQPGMRLHYDQTLPKIAEELTGDEGKKVSFGEHKMAFGPKGDNEEWIELLKQPRKDLIFRNEKGEPKTDVSARVYDISKAKKEFSLYGRMGSIFPESSAAKAFKDLGATEVQPHIVDTALHKLDSLRSTGEDIYGVLASSHAWNSWYMKRQGYDLPKIESISPSFANAVSKYANSQVSSVLRANANISKVLGDKVNNEQFRKQLGGVIYEDMRRADGNKGNSVLKLKNSPFANEAQYQAALKNPEIQKALTTWKDLIQKPATEMHEKLGGSLAESGKETGAFANLIAVMKDETKEPVENSPSTVGPLSTMKKGSAFSKERQFTGQEYNLDAKDMALRMMTKNAQQAALRDLYEEGDKAGLVKLLKQGDEVPAGMVRQKNPVTLNTVIKDGEVFHKSAYPAFDKRIESTLAQALQLDKSTPKLLDNPLMHTASQVIIKTQVGLGIDLGFHTFNDMVAVANSPKGLLALPSKVMQVAKAQHDLVTNNQSVQEELARMAEAGVTFRGESLGGWSSHALKVADTVTRLVLNREYESLVKAKRVVDSPAERRRYINGRAGQYNKRFMTWFQQGMQESGLGAFNVAGRNFNRLAVGNLTMSPGVKATSNVDALRLRLSIAAGIATAALVVPSAINIATTGTARPEGTEIGDIVLHQNKDGTKEVINMRKWTMLARGGRASGIGDVMNEQVMPRLRGEQPAS